MFIPPAIALVVKNALDNIANLTKKKSPSMKEKIEGLEPAKALEELLNGDIDLDAPAQKNGLIGELLNAKELGFGQKENPQQNASGLEPGLPPGKVPLGLGNFQEVGEIVSKAVEQEAQRWREQIDACWCPVCKSRLWLDREEAGFVLRLPTSHNSSQPANHTSQTSSRRTVIQPNTRYGEDGQPIEGQNQTGSEILEERAGKGTWDIQADMKMLGAVVCLTCRQYVVPNIHKELLPHHELAA